MGQLKTPFIRSITKNSLDSHQTSPAYLLTFIRWSNRDTINYTERFRKEKKTITRRALTVINDATNVTISDVKNGITPALSIVLKAGDLNYSTAVHPGDYVLVNLVNSQRKAVELGKRAISGKPINRFNDKVNDGFKGLFKIQTVRRQVITDPKSGIKFYSFVVHAYGFTELNTLIYYNPVVGTVFKNSSAFFLTQFTRFWGDIISSYKNENTIQGVLKILVKALLGIGLNNDDLLVPATQNSQFIVPPLLGPLLNRPNAKVIPDIYNWVFGVWKDRTFFNEKKRSIGKISPGEGFNPGIRRSGRNRSFYEVRGRALQGWKILAYEDFNQKTIWSIMNSYLNGSINESYTTTRVGPDGFVYPTVIFRQKPFSSEHFNNPDADREKTMAKQPKTGNIPHTKFMELPRWKIDPDMIYKIDLGKDEAARINFVHLFGRSVAVMDTINHALQAQNIFFDPEDIKRHGLKPAVLTANFDFPNLENAKDVSKLKSQDWAYILFDMLNAGQLRESGVISCVGIEEPIVPGDNLEFDNAVYHIEQVDQIMNTDSEGVKSFRTNLKLSFGTSMDSDAFRPVYPQMTHTDRLKESKRDKNIEGILPGFSDTQSLPSSEITLGVKNGSRRFGEEIKTTPEESFTRVEVKKKARSRTSKVGFIPSNKRKKKINGKT